VSVRNHELCAACTEGGLFVDVGVHRITLGAVLVEAGKSSVSTERG
jgi:hypothetical protein